MTTERITLTVSINIEADERDLTTADVLNARQKMEDAIYQRLIGDGFLPDDLLVADWQIK